MKKITIITVTLNNIKNIEQTIKSVLDQNYNNLEYILIDGGSTDGSLEIINKYKDKFKYFKSSADKGVYDAMNKGIAEATGEYVGFVNGGDFIYEGTLNDLNKIFSKHKTNFFFSVADVDYVDDQNNLIGSKICRSSDQIIKKRFIEMPTNHLGIFMPLDVFKKYGLFDLRFNYRADYHLVLKIIKNGYRPLRLERKIGAFRLGGVSGRYSTFFENYKVIRSVGEKFWIAAYSTFLGVTKLFFQNNFPIFYRYVASTYYKITNETEREEFSTIHSYKICHVIDSDTGGGAEKLVSIFQKTLNNKFIITINKLSEKNKFNTNYNSLNIKINEPLSFIRAVLNLIKILSKIKRNEKILLHSHLSKSLYITSIAAIFLGIDHIHTEHNTYNKRRSIKYLYLIEYFIYNSLKHIICISEPTRFNLLSYMQSIKLENISVIENGTKLLNHKVRNLKKEKYNILLLGSLTYKKGIDIFIETLPFLSNKINQVKIIGSGPEKEKLLDLTKKLSLESIVDFIPFVDDPSNFIYNSDIGIIPSRWEGFGMVALEMRSSGMPILISDTPGLYNLFSKYNGVYSFKTNSKDSLKNSFRKLLDDLNKVKIEELNTDFEIYSENSFINRYDKFYDKMKNI